MSVLIVGALYVLSSQFIVPVSPATMPAPRISDWFLRSMTETPFVSVAVRSVESPRLTVTHQRGLAVMSGFDGPSPDAFGEALRESWGSLGFRSDGPRRSLGRQVDIEGVK